MIHVTQADTIARGTLLSLVSLWALALLISGYQPKDTITWWMEVMPVILAAPLLLMSYRSFPLTRVTYAWIFVHGLVLMLGGHYTYAEVPLGFWVQDAFGLARNHYDRLGHFMQGFVPALVAREVIVRKAGVSSRGWTFFFVVTACMSISVTYEFIEWWAALILGQGADAFLGTQGDPWDTQWDMFLATVGAITAQIVHLQRSPKTL